ncbi:MULTISPECIES: DUF2339 domain-containing protein [unclassified Brenneria]|uniref:DUF2339 domain-containing protein n=1 Tax=unclassified Brenneria TaxID=2634434 RepID=UPI0020A6263A|nr:DUF2339 domain-containing protein [Brenneria sp. hezel4-2-4]MEE3650437.1 DUF2339 domain-containing protein [Brenneria sp. HEZEL_4_2_4]
MDDSMWVIGLWLLLIYIILMPFVVLVAYKRSLRNQQRTEQLAQTVAQLRSDLTRISAQITQPPHQAYSPSSPGATTLSPMTSALAEADAATQPVIPSADVDAAPVKEDASSSADNVWRSASSESHSGLFSSLAGWLLQGNPLAKIGILLLFFGLAYLMKFSIEHDILSIEWRLGIAALISGGLLAFGWCLRRRQRLYALILQGGAVGALYITIFGAFRLYLLLPYTLAFALLLAVCAASVGLAVLQRSLSLAMLASIGGYLAPILLSQGSGDHVVLFSYYLLLSLGILTISARQSWRELNLLGMIFTFGVATVWGAEHYQPAHYLSSQLFLIVNILIFGVGALHFSLRHQPVGKQIVDGLLLFAPPLIGFGMQYLITQPWTYGPALSALGYGLFYLSSGIYFRRKTPRLGLFSLALSACFLTLSVPLAFSAQWTSMTWLLEGLCVLWAGLYQNQRRMGWSGAAIMLLGVLSAGYALFFTSLTVLSFLFIFGILAMTALCTSLCWRRYRQVETHWRAFSRIFFMLGIATWLGWLLYAVDRALNAYVAAFWHGSEFMPPWRTHALLFPPLLLLTIALSALIWHTAGRRLNWAALRYSGGLLWGAILLAVLQQFLGAEYRQLPLLNIGEQLTALGSWLACFAIAYRLLYRDEISLPIRLTQGFHLSLFWMWVSFLFLMASQYLYPLIPPQVEEGAPLLTIVLLSAIVIALASPTRHRLWPLTRWAPLYNRTGLVPLVAILFTLLGNVNLMDGQWNSDQAFYIPLFNPLEAGMALALAALVIGYRRMITASAQNAGLRRRCRFALWLLGFWLLNGMLLRALASYTPIPWSADALWDSRLVQTTFALLWTLSALIGMVWSTRRQQRGGWLAGAALLGVTIVKLFLVDSAVGGGLARAVAFIGVAILILIVGYFAPLPPKQRSSASAI